MQHLVGRALPVVEVAGDDQRRVGRNLGAHEVDQERRLPHAAPLDQAEVRVDQVDVERSVAVLRRATRRAAGPASPARGRRCRG